jgi:nitrous oxidase accessory protein NosD
VAIIAPVTAAAATLDVCADGCAFSELGPALEAARNGDTVHVAAGTYLGGVTIDASIKVQGAGAGKTIVQGGGPVLTIGVFGAKTEPTVVLEGLTITGGVTHSSPVSNARVDHDNVIALGGGVEIPPSAAWEAWSVGHHPARRHHRKPGCSNRHRSFRAGTVPGRSLPLRVGQGWWHRQLG